MLKVMGVDPGLAATGIGIVTGEKNTIHSFAHGCITTSADLSVADRLDLIYSQVKHVLESETPDLMVIEDAFVLRENPKSGLSLGKVIGVILLAASQNKISVIEVSVRSAKQVLTGNGNASKSQLEGAVRHFLQSDVPISPYHASDALALALLGLFRN